MLSLQLIRTQPDFIKERLKVKNFKDLSVVDDIIALDIDRRKALTELETMKANMNVLSKEIGALMGKGLKEEAEQKKSETAQLKDKILVPLMQGTANVSMSVKTISGAEIILPSLEIQETVIETYKKVKPKVDFLNNI